MFSDVTISPCQSQVTCTGCDELIGRHSSNKLNVLCLPLSHICDLLAILNYDLGALGQCAITLSQLKNTIPHVLEHLTYQEPNLTTYPNYLT